MGDRNTGYATASMVLGILAVVFMFFTGVPGWVCIILAIIGLILASRGLRECPSGQPGHGMAVAGVVLNVIALATSALALVCVMGACATLGAFAVIA